MKIEMNKELKFWNSFSGRYDDFIKYTLGTTYQKLFVKLREDVTGTENILEIATGTGLLSFEICKLVHHINAIDIAPEMIRIAQKKQAEIHALNIDFEVGDTSNLQFRDGSFDKVIASNVLHLLADPDEALSEISRVLKPEGKAFLITFCHGENLRSRLISRFMELSGFKARNRWTVKSYATFIQASGFEIQTMEILPGKIPLVYIIAGKTNIR